MIGKKGKRFDFHESGHPLYLSTVQKNVDKCATTCKLGMGFWVIAIMRMYKSYWCGKRCGNERQCSAVRPSTAV